MAVWPTLSLSFSVLLVWIWFEALGSIDGTAYHDILDNSVIPTLWQQFGEGPFLFQHNNAPVTRAQVHKNCFPTLVWKSLTGLHRALT